MYWIKINNEADKNLIINGLKALGFTSSRWSAPEENAVAIALYVDLYDAHGFGGDKNYIFLNDEMCSEDPHTSWITTRAEVNTPQEFIDGAEKMLKIKQMKLLK